MADTVAPTLTSLILDDLVIGGNFGSAFDFFRAGAVGGSSGVDHVTLTLDRSYVSADEGHPRVSEITFIGSNPYTGFVGVGTDTTPGVYHVAQAAVFDKAGNVATYSTEQLSAAGIQNQFTISTLGMPDVSRPTLSLISLPANIVTSAAGTPAEFYLNASDTGSTRSGIAEVVVRFDRALQTTSGAVDRLTFVPSDPDNTLLRTTLNVTSATASGLYNVGGVTLTDRVGNTVTYNGADLAALGLTSHFVVDDRTAPVITSLSTGTADVRNGVAGVPITVTATDASGNFDRVELKLDRTVSVPSFVGHGIHSAYERDTLFVVSNGGVFYNESLDPETRPGTYTITQAIARDTAGNSTTYTTADLARLGYSTSFTVVADATAPTLTALSLPSLPVTPDGVADTRILLGFAGLDTGSDTFRSVEAMLRFNRSINSVYPTPDRYIEPGATGLITAGALTPGLYVLSTATLTDYVGNERVYGSADVAALGLNTAFVIAETVQAGGSIQARDGFYVFKGGSGTDQVALNGNIGDYTLSRVASSAAGTQFDGNGLFVLTAKNGGSIYYFDQAVETVRFQNQQYLALKDLSAYVAGGIAPSATLKDSVHVYQQAAGGVLTFVGDSTTNTAILTGGIGDFTARTFVGDIARDGTQLSGIELFGTNGSGILLIDKSIEYVQFGNGRVVSLADVQTLVAPDMSAKPSGTLHVAGADAHGLVSVPGGAGIDVVLTDRPLTNYYYSGSRGSAGEFVLRFGDDRLVLGQAVETVQFVNGQYLALKDLPFYVAGDFTFTAGTAANDILVAGPSGNQYITGGAGTDLAEIHGNAGDYLVREVHLAATATTPAIDGYELFGLNRSGNLYIDRSTETIQLQNGTIVNVADLGKLTTAIATTGTAGSDIFVAEGPGDQYVNGGGGYDDLYVSYNTRDYVLREVHLAATASHARIDGYELAARDGSGSVYIDASVESVHFQNGQYLAYNDLNYFIGH